MTEKPVRGDQGASMMEYALLVVLVAIIALVAIRDSGSQVSSVFAQVGRQLADAPLGNVNTSAPQRFVVGSASPVVVSVTPQDLLLPLSSLQTLVPIDPATTSIELQPVLEATLGGSNFEIAPLSPKGQAIRLDRPTQWTWDATPTISGDGELLAVIQAVVTVDGKDAPVVLKSIRIRTSASLDLPREGGRALDKHLDALLAGLGALYLGWQANNFKRRGHEKPSPDSLGPVESAASAGLRDADFLGWVAALEGVNDVEMIPVQEGYRGLRYGRRGAEYLAIAASDRIAPASMLRLLRASGQIPGTLAADLARELSEGSTEADVLVAGRSAVAAWENVCNLNLDLWVFCDGAGADADGEIRDLRGTVDCSTVQT